MHCSMALPSKLCAALHGQSNVGSSVIAIHAEVWTCQFWWKFYQELTVTKVQVPEGKAFNIKSNIKKVMLTKGAPLSSHLADKFCKLDNFFLTSQASKLY